jgi:hypothetical protein
MSNTTIQIKRSSTTSTPSGGSLSAAEQAYSFLSDKLFIGDSTGTGVIAIGGKFYVDQQNTIFNVANAAFAAANSSLVANDAYSQANAAYNKANTVASDLANTAIAANNYAGEMVNSANAYASSTYLPFTGGTLTGDLNITANLTVTGTTTYVNTQSLLVSDNIFVLNSDLDGATAPTQDAGMEINRGSSANVSVLWNETSEKWTFTNDGSTYLNIASNTDVETATTSANSYAGVMANSANGYADSVGSSANNYAGFMANAANAYAVTVGQSGNAYADFVGAAANAYAVVVGSSGNAYAQVVGDSANAYTRVFANSVGTSANAYADVVGGAANTNAANGSYISTGVVKVPYGGTGQTSFTENGILFGNTSGDLKVTAAGTEGNVLQVNSSGVPQFGMLDGGNF